MAHPLFDTRERDYPASAPTLANPASAPTPEDKSRKTHPLVITGLVLALIIFTVFLGNLAIMSIAAPSGEPASAVPEPTPQQGQELALPPSAGLQGLSTTMGEGRFLVGTDIAPGTYETTGPSGSLDCYWERLKDTNGAVDSIIANNLGPYSATVTIEASDAAFQTRWCNTWTKVS